MQQTGMPPFAPPYAGLASWAWKFLKAPAGCPANPRPQRALSKAYDLCPAHLLPGQPGPGVHTHVHLRTLVLLWPQPQKASEGPLPHSCKSLCYVQCYLRPCHPPLLHLLQFRGAGNVPVTFCFCLRVENSAQLAEV